MGIKKTADTITGPLKTIDIDMMKKARAELAIEMKKVMTTAQTEFFRDGTPGKRAEYSAAAGMKRGHFVRHAVKPSPPPTNAILTRRNAILKRSIIFWVRRSAEVVRAVIYYRSDAAPGGGKADVYGAALARKNKNWNPIFLAADKVFSTGEFKAKIKAIFTDLLKGKK